MAALLVLTAATIALAFARGHRESPTDLVLSDSGMLATLVSFATLASHPLLRHPALLMI
jgi:hypothetical protein